MKKRDTQAKIERSKELLKLLDYNPETGEFKWKVTLNNRALKGSRAGGKDGRGYISIRYKREQHLAHRLAFLLSGREIPEGFVVDHINNIRDDNRLSNLRLLSRSANALNRKRKLSTGNVDFIGKSYAVRFIYNKKQFRKGGFLTKEDAASYKDCLLNLICDLESKGIEVDIRNLLDTL